jgi:adenylate cyclase
MLKAYRAQDWDQADVALLNLRRLHPNAPLYGLYAERIAQHRTRPPAPSWDGVTAFEEK